MSFKFHCFTSQASNPMPWHTHFTHAWLGKSSAWTICLMLQSYPRNMRSCLQKGVQEYCPCLSCQAPAGVAWNLTLLDNEIVRQNLSLDSFWCFFLGLSRSNHFSPSLCNFMCPDLFLSPKSIINTAMVTWICRHIITYAHPDCSTPSSESKWGSHCYGTWLSPTTGQNEDHFQSQKNGGNQRNPLRMEHVEVFRCPNQLESQNVPRFTMGCKCYSNGQIKGPRTIAISLLFEQL